MRLALLPVLLVLGLSSVSEAFHLVVSRQQRCTNGVTITRARTTTPANNNFRVVAPLLSPRRRSTHGGAATTTTSLWDAPLPDLVGAGTTSPLMTFFLQTLIASGVPAAFSILVIVFAALTVFKRRGGRRGSMDDDDELFDNPNSPVAALYNDLYGDQLRQQKSSKRFLSRLLGGGSSRRGGGDDSSSMLPTNVGVPSQEYLKVRHLNRQYDSYQYSLTAATQSKAAAAARYRQESLRRALGKSLLNITPSAWQELQRLEKDFIKEATAIYDKWQDAVVQETRLKLDGVLQEMGLESVYQLDPPPLLLTAAANNTANATDIVSSSKIVSIKNNKKKNIPSTVESRLSELEKTLENKLHSLESGVDIRVLHRRVAMLEKALADVEWEFVTSVLQAVGPANAPLVRTALLGDAATRGFVAGRLVLELQQRPLTTVLLGNDSSSGSTTGMRKPILYVCRFPGDVSASQVVNLREEVTAITRNVQQGDEALVILQSGGGTVTGYGLAAAQLVRLKSVMKLTIAVEQVAASGGYMMCCVADKIVASPFAVLGSIGVISDIPNVYERLKKEGIEFQTVTAGKYKRTLTPTKKPSKEDFDKAKADIEDVLVLFRDFVAENRPQLNMDQVATGETWFGRDALDRKLCDELKPVDDIITEYVDAGFDVFEVEYSPPPEESSSLAQLLPIGSSPSSSSSATTSSDASSWLRQGIRWAVRTVASEIKAELGAAVAETPPEQRIMAKNDDADRIRAQS